MKRREGTKWWMNRQLKRERIDMNKKDENIGKNGEEKGEEER